ncbi:hypothetical protein SBRCBS47491_006588 [Sporothrix bragantina]|uniref:beta-glucosidase n=1 Tax=Sporothrix bragantina TaxID=671064 RepID=A0ABP0C6H5_9PEZI
MDGQPGWTLRRGSPSELDSPDGSPASHGVSLAGMQNPFSGPDDGTGIELLCDLYPAETGTHYLAASGTGPTQVFIDDELVYEQTSNTADAMGFLFGAMDEIIVRHAFKKHRAYRLRVRASATTFEPGLEILCGRSGVRVGMVLQSVRERDLTAEAVALAKEADVCIVVAGHDAQWETEGQDQVSFALPADGSQDRRIEAVSAANPCTIVVNMTGTPVAMPWQDSVASILQAWFPGQEAGNAIADVLTGAVNPEGHLPVTFPHRIEDTPAFGNFPGELVADGSHRHLRVEYQEGVLVGYKHYQRGKQTAASFAFGNGLSYATFVYGQPVVTKTAVSGKKQDLCVAVDVTNTGAYPGRALVQIYCGLARGPARCRWIRAAPCELPCRW